MLIFENKGLIDETALTVSGVSAKIGDNPIGQFGTGIKYGIAIVLRLGGEVEVWRGRKLLKFGIREKTVRGQKFRIVTMNERALGYTDQLGMNWEPWMAYREFWSNARDEGGSARRVESEDDIEVGPGRTMVIVRCPELERSHEERHKIILQTEPLVVCPGVEIHAGVSGHVYYRGIRVGELEGTKGTKSAYTYNLTGQQELTEDRTLKWPWMVAGTVARGIVQCTNIAVLMDIIGHQDGGPDKIWEATLPFAQVRDQKPSPQFMEVADQLSIAKKLRSGAGDVFRHYQDTLPGYQSPYLVTLTAAEEEILSAAVSRVASLGIEMNRGAISFKSRLELGRVQVASSGSLVLDHGLVAEGPGELACRLVEGMAMLAGGKSAAHQLARFLVFRAFAPTTKGKYDFA